MAIETDIISTSKYIDVAYFIGLTIIFGVVLIPLRFKVDNAALVIMAFYELSILTRSIDKVFIIEWP